MYRRKWRKTTILTLLAIEAIRLDERIYIIIKSCAFIVHTNIKKRKKQSFANLFTFLWIRISNKFSLFEHAKSKQKYKENKKRISIKL